MKKTFNIMSVLSILDLLVAITLGAWIGIHGNDFFDGTSLLEVHIIQGIAAGIITSITLLIVLIWKETNKKIIMIVASLLLMIGLVFSSVSGWFIYQYDGVLAAIARSFHFHGIQVVSTAIMTIVFLSIAVFSGRNKQMRLKNVEISIADEKALTHKNRLVT